MHIFDLSKLLLGADESVLVPLARVASVVGISMILIVFNSFFIDNCHFVEIIQGQIQVLAGLSLHLRYFQVVLHWNLGYFEACFARFLLEVLRFPVFGVEI